MEEEDLKAFAKENPGAVILLVRIIDNKYYHKVKHKIWYDMLGRGEYE